MQNGPEIAFCQSGQNRVKIKPNWRGLKDRWEQGVKNGGVGNFVDICEKSKIGLEDKLVLVAADFEACGHIRIVSVCVQSWMC